MVQHVTGSVAVAAQVGVVAYSRREPVRRRGRSTPGVALPDRIDGGLVMTASIAAVTASGSCCARKTRIHASCKKRQDRRHDTHGRLRLKLRDREHPRDDTVPAWSHRRKNRRPSGPTQSHPCRVEPDHRRVLLTRVFRPGRHRRNPHAEARTPGRDRSGPDRGSGPGWRRRSPCTGHPRRRFAG